MYRQYGNSYEKYNQNAKWDLDYSSTELSHNNMEACFGKELVDIDLDNLPLDLIFDKDETYSPSKSDTDVYSPSDDEISLINSNLFPGLKIILDGMPSRSRIENQIKLTLKFFDSESSSKFNYRRIFIDESQIDPCSLKKKKNKLTEDSINTAKISPHLFLECSVLRSSDLKQVFRCPKCIKRERKMKERRKNNNIVFNYFVSENCNEVISSECDLLDSRKILQFHTGLFLDIKDNRVTLPFRITCYSRHHNELNGFVLKMKLIDGHTNLTVFEFYSPKIVITDDRRKTKQCTENRKKRSSYDVNSNNPTSKTQKMSSSKDFTKLDKPFRVVNKIIPSEGPLCGGIEITVLGKDFDPGDQCYFGGYKAITQFWNPGALICILPSCPTPGAVTVSVSQSNNPRCTEVYSDSPVFIYKDEDKKQKIMSLALQIIGKEMTGIDQEAKKIAKDIINNHYS